MKTVIKVFAVWMLFIIAGIITAGMVEVFGFESRDPQLYAVSMISMWFIYGKLNKK